jgi:hypothetical protein
MFAYSANVSQEGEGKPWWVIEFGVIEMLRMYVGKRFILSALRYGRLSLRLTGVNYGN